MHVHGSSTPGRPGGGRPVGVLCRQPSYGSCLSKDFRRESCLRKHPQKDGPEVPQCPGRRPGAERWAKGPPCPCTVPEEEPGAGPPAHPGPGSRLVETQKHAHTRGREAGASRGLQGTPGHTVPGNPPIKKLPGRPTGAAGDPLLGRKVPGSPHVGGSWGRVGASQELWGKRLCLTFINTV